MSAEHPFLKKLTWFHQAAFRVEGGPLTIYIDPFELEGHDGPKADLVLITHDHFDHCDEKAARWLRKPTAPLILHPGCPKKYPGTVKVLAPGQKHQVGQVTIEAVPAYNVKPDRLNYHPKKNNWVGYILTIDGTRLYHAGDTDFIPEMKSLKADIALLPIGGTYTMDAAEAAEAAAAIKPQVAVPMHFGKIVGDPKDGETFKKLSKVPVAILPQGG